MKTLLIVISVVCMQFEYGQALDYEGIEEFFTCDKFVVDPQLEETWMSKFPIVYTTLWNKVDIYQNAEDFLGKDEFAELTPRDLQKTCAYYKLNGNNVAIDGFEGHILNYAVFPDPVRKGISYWTKVEKNGERKYIATAYVTKTDNKSYFVAISIWENGRKGFNVGSNIPKLDENTIQEIKSHLTEIGFKPEHFVEQDYDKCPPPPADFTAIVQNMKMN